MKPLFTIHHGEYVVGSYIERHFKGLNVWIPSRDIGVDLLITNNENTIADSLRVKFSKDYTEGWHAAAQKQTRSFGWWTIDRQRLTSSNADLWVFVLFGFAAPEPDFVIIPPVELERRLSVLRGSQDTKRFQTYLWVTRQNQCWEARDLKHGERDKILKGEFEEPKRDFSIYLNKWRKLKTLNGKP